MFAGLAGIVFFSQDALSTGNTRGEVTSTFFAVNITIDENYGGWVTYNSVILALQSLLGQLNSFFGLSMGGCLEKRLMANISYYSLSLSVISGSLSSLTKALEHSL